MTIITSRNAISITKHNEYKLKPTIIVLFLYINRVVTRNRIQAAAIDPFVNLPTANSKKLVSLSIVRKYLTTNTLLFCQLNKCDRIVWRSFLIENAKFNILIFFLGPISEAFNSSRTKPATIILSALHTWTRINRPAHCNTGVVRHQWYRRKRSHSYTVAYYKEDNKQEILDPLPKPKRVTDI